ILATTEYTAAATATAGPYYIKAVNAAGCSNIRSVTVTVNAIPSLVIVDPKVCAPATADLTALAVKAGSDTGLTYSYWSDANATTVLDAPNTATNGTYFIKAIN